MWPMRVAGDGENRLQKLQAEGGDVKTFNSHQNDNNPNPILVAFRQAQSTHNGIKLADEWLRANDAHESFGGYKHWESPGHPFLSIIGATIDERAHATRVLSRLAVLT